MMDMPISATPGSSVNSPRKKRPPTSTMALKSTLVKADMPMQTRTLLWMRSYLPAPKFCPAKVVMETP